MKLSVLLNSSRADDTITAVKTLLSQVGPDNQLEVVVRFNNPEIEAAALKYMPKDDRIVINGTPSGEKCWIIGDAGLTLPPFWDNDLNIQKNFVDYTPPVAESGGKVAENGEIAQEIPINIANPGEEITYGQSAIAEEINPQEDWQFTNIVDIDATTRLAILKKV